VKLVLMHQKMEISRLDRVLDLLDAEGSDNGDDAYGEEDRNEVAEVVGVTEGKRSERTEGKKDARTEGAEPMVLDKTDSYIVIFFNEVVSWSCFSKGRIKIRVTEYLISL
jgi:hypothetical protein